MSEMDLSWLTVEQRDAPLIVSLPHTGTDIPDDIAAHCSSLTIARRDADWWIDRLYDFVAGLGATVIHTRISRTVIDVNRDPSGVALYPGQATTELVPTTTFDGVPLWKPGHAPGADEITRRRRQYYDPYHDALRTQISRLTNRHPRIVLYDCHSIRSRIPRLFQGELPVFNIGTNCGRSCNTSLEANVAAIAAASGLSHVVNGRFTGGYITRSYGDPTKGVHAVQMELACRGYMHEPMGAIDDTVWPTAYDAAFAAPIRATLKVIIAACRQFAEQPPAQDGNRP